jgi:hypothetical protein
MSRVLKDELQDLRKKIMTCFRETLPSKQFNALLSLSTIWLGVLADRGEKIQDQEERRRIEDEFEKGEKALKNGIRYVYEKAEGRNTEPTELLQ